ncbi:MAG TPA: metal ABC transporter ATP-binding protein [bacterium]|jgi:zinc transport system ATP-binding protein
MNENSPAIELSGLSVHLGDHLTLDDVTASCGRGEFIAIIGPNGAGKTTLLRAVLGLIKRYSGTIKIFGKSIDRNDPSEIGFVPQLKSIDRNFPAITCDIVSTGLHKRLPGFISRKEHDLIHDTLELVGASHLCDRPFGILSGGEMQRVFLARALIRRPKLLLLDEPATGIDAIGEGDLYKILDRFTETSGATVLMVTHDMLVARHHADKILLLNRTLICFDTPEIALSDKYMSEAFGHVGHIHPHGEEHAHD